MTDKQRNYVGFTFNVLFAIGVKVESLNGRLCLLMELRPLQANLSFLSAGMDHGCGGLSIPNWPLLNVVTLDQLGKQD